MFTPLFGPFHPSLRLILVSIFFLISCLAFYFVKYLIVNLSFRRIIFLSFSTNTHSKHVYHDCILLWLVNQKVLMIAKMTNLEDMVWDRIWTFFNQYRISKRWLWHMV